MQTYSISIKFNQNLFISVRDETFDQMLSQHYDFILCTRKADVT
jgi:hypothetical protein